MIELSIHGAAETAANMKALGADVTRTEERSLSAASLILRGELGRQMSQQGETDAFWGRMGAVGGLARRSGGTANRLSPGGQVHHVGAEMFVSVGSPDRYVADLETGGARDAAGYFRIPTAAAQTAAGVDRWAGRSFREYPGGFLVRTKTGRLWGAVSSAGGRAITFLYLFVKHITQRPHRTFQRARDAAEPKVAALIGREMEIAVRRHA